MHPFLYLFGLFGCINHPQFNSIGTGPEETVIDRSIGSPGVVTHIPEIPVNGEILYKRPVPVKTHGIIDEYRVRRGDVNLLDILYFQVIGCLIEEDLPG
ncbi:hypothetical protein ES708_11582 [subsurface metagenome]